MSDITEPAGEDGLHQIARSPLLDPEITRGEQCEDRQNAETYESETQRAALVKDFRVQYGLQFLEPDD